MKSSPKEQHYRRPIGFLEALNASRRIQKYHDLIMIENFSYIHDEDERNRLRKDYAHLFESDKPQPKYEKLRKEINKLTVQVYWSLRRINAPTRWREDTEELEYDLDKHRNTKNKKTENFDVILDRQYPVYRNKKGFKDAETTYPILEQSKSVFDSIWKKYWMRLVNPLWWIAFVLRLPISLIEYMGVDTETTNVNKFIYWFVQAIVLLVLSFIALKLGINAQIALPW